MKKYIFLSTVAMFLVACNAQTPSETATADSVKSDSVKDTTCITKVVLDTLAKDTVR